MKHSTDTELTTLDTHDLWLPESSEPKPSTMSALHHFGVEMLKLSRGLGAEGDGTTEDEDFDDDVDSDDEPPPHCTPGRAAARLDDLTPTIAHLLPVPGLGLAHRKRSSSFG